MNKVVANKVEILCIKSEVRHYWSQGPSVLWHMGGEVNFILEISSLFSNWKVSVLVALNLFRSLRRKFPTLNERVALTHAVESRRLLRANLVFFPRGNDEERWREVSPQFVCSKLLRWPWEEITDRGWNSLFKNCVSFWTESQTKSYFFVIFCLPLKSVNWTLWALTKHYRENCAVFHPWKRI